MATAAENKLAKRSKILDAANRLFLDGSFADTAIDDVVALAGVAKGTFYLYFRDKYDLLDQIVVHRALEIFTQSCAQMRSFAAQRSMTAAEQIIFLADGIVEYLQAHRKEAALLDKRFAICFTSADPAPHESFADAVSYLTELLMQNSGRTLEQAQQTLYLLGNMILYAACDAVLGGKPYTVEEIKPTLYGMIRTVLDGGDAA